MFLFFLRFAEPACEPIGYWTQGGLVRRAIYDRTPAVGRQGFSLPAARSPAPHREDGRKDDIEFPMQTDTVLQGDCLELMPGILEQVKAKHKKGRPKEATLFVCLIS